MLRYINKEAEMVNLKGTSFLSGVEKLPPRSEKCVREVQGACDFSLILLHLNSLKEFPSSARCMSRNITKQKVRRL